MSNRFDELVVCYGRKRSVKRQHSQYHDLSVALFIALTFIIYCPPFFHFQLIYLSIYYAILKTQLVIAWGGFFFIITFMFLDFED